MKSGIYIITNLLDGKMIVGYTIDFNRRKKEHFNMLKEGNHYNTYLQRAVNKYGIENFIFEILEEYPDEGFILPSMEHYWCNLLQTHNPEYGYNDRPTHPYNRPTNSLATREKLRIANTGKKHTEETKEKLRKANIGKKHSEQTKAKKRNSSLGKRHKEESKKKMSDYRFKNPLKPNLGKKLSKETIEKSVSKRKKKVNQFDLQGNFIKTWESGTLASKELKISKGNINSCCKGNRSYAGGFIWKYFK